jgi:hypothetical protein
LSIFSSELRALCCKKDLSKKIVFQFIEEKMSFSKVHKKNNKKKEKKKKIFERKILFDYLSNIAHFFFQIAQCKKRHKFK